MGGLHPVDRISGIGMFGGGRGSRLPEIRENFCLSAEIGLVLSIITSVINHLR